MYQKLYKNHLKYLSFRPVNRNSRCTVRGFEKSISDILGKFAYFTTSHTRTNNGDDKADWYDILYPCWSGRYDISYLNQLRCLATLPNLPDQPSEIEFPELLLVMTVTQQEMNLLQFLLLKNFLQRKYMGDYFDYKGIKTIKKTSQLLNGVR